MTNARIVGKKAAILVENGFCERELVQAQNALNALGIDCRLVSIGHSLVRGWNEDENPSNSHWGGDYAPDVTLEESFSGNYDVLVIPGGVRSIMKLKLSDNIKPFISAFVKTGKPVIAYNQAIDLLSFTGAVSGYSLAAQNDLCNIVVGQGGQCAVSDFIVSDNLITLSRFKDITDELQRAVLCIFNGVPYTDTNVSPDNMPHPSKVA
ncbi:MAG: hypothetical protein COA45_03395 [Zetaproteobacteria bacterium]|nr:MAG: hypothetical protein COA45_03395 [Zetaproteobacteria bacterium]